MTKLYIYVYTYIYIYVCICMCVCVCVCVYVFVYSVLFRAIEGGRMSQSLDKLSRKAPILFGGKFKVPIREAIAPAAQQVVCISTGVGLGVCVCVCACVRACVRAGVRVWGGCKCM
jgi:hypothetical protein